MYCHPPALSTPAVVLTAFEFITGSLGTLPSAKIEPVRAGNAAPPLSALRAYCMDTAERMEPS